MKIVPFDFQGTGLRVLTGEDGEPWFVAADVCKAIGLASHKGSYKHHLEKLDEDERKAVAKALIDGDPMLNMGVAAQSFVQSAGSAVLSDPQVWLISESAVYTLILRGREATTPGSLQHQFKRWVTHEVLPSIRRTGRYEAPGAAARPVEPKRQIAQGDWMDQAMRNAEGLIHLALSTMDPATAASRMPGLSRPDVAMGLAGILLRTQRFLLEFEHIEHPSLRLLHPKEKIVSVYGDGWAERFVATLDRDQLKQLMQAAVQRLA